MSSLEFYTETKMLKFLPEPAEDQEILFKAS